MKIQTRTKRFIRHQYLGFDMLTMLCITGVLDILTVDGALTALAVIAILILSEVLGLQHLF